MAANVKSFRKGQSGNPTGKPQGARNRVTRVLDDLMEGEAETISKKVVELAKDGDLVAARMVLDRVAPPRKDRRISFDLPDITTAAEAVQAGAAIMRAVASGELSPGEAEALSKLVANIVTTIDAAEFAERLVALEAAVSAQRPGARR